MKEEDVKEWIMDFHKFRIHGLFSESEKQKVWDRLCKLIKKEGFTFQQIGFYDYKIEKI
jgi:hypothetical protein